MYHYPHHISDFNNATRHLTRVERALYRDAIEMYYDTEQPLPGDDFDRLAKRLIAVSDEEKSALRDVLNEFFTLKDGAYHHARCDLEIAKYRANAESKSKAGRASAAKRQHKATPVEHVLNGCATNQEPRTKNQEPVCLPPSEVGKTVKPVCPPCPIEEIIETYHETLPTNPRFLVRNETRDGYIRSRWKQFFSEGDFTDKGGGVECFRWFFSEKVKPSKFLTGQAAARNGSPPFIADLEWLMRPTNFAKVVEGKYS